MHTRNRYLVIGGSGMLGRAVREELAERADPFDAPSSRELNLLDRTALVPGVRGYGAVFNCAGWTDVDAAESHEAQAEALNAHAVADLANACREAGARLVHYSTDYVFNGSAHTPYPVDTARSPINAYGRTKALGEELLEREMARGLSALLIRTSWLYAPWGKNFVRTIARLAQHKPTLTVVNDQRGRPTSAQHLARASLRLVRAGAQGALHVTDGGECTWYEFARVISERVNPACLVHPCSTSEFPRPARRPAYSVLDLGPGERLLGPMPPWPNNLGAVLDSLEP